MGNSGSLIVIVPISLLYKAIPSRSLDIGYADLATDLTELNDFRLS
jgi:hypothetical protein